jgi:hypothetical protein
MSRQNELNIAGDVVGKFHRESYDWATIGSPIAWQTVPVKNHHGPPSGFPHRLTVNGLPIENQRIERLGHCQILIDSLLDQVFIVAHRNSMLGLVPDVFRKLRLFWRLAKGSGVRTEPLVAVKLD